MRCKCHQNITLVLQGAAQGAIPFLQKEGLIIHNSKNKKHCQQQKNNCHMFPGFLISFLFHGVQIFLLMKKKKANYHLLSLFFLNLEMFCKFNLNQSNVLLCFFHFQNKLKCFSFWCPSCLFTQFRFLYQGSVFHKHQDLFHY